MFQIVVDYVNQLTGNDSYITGQILGAVTLVMSASAAFMLKTVPISIAKFVRRQLITTLYVNNTDWYKNHTFIKLSSFLYERANERGSRTLSFDTYWDDGKQIIALTIGTGYHFFFYHNRLCWLVKEDLPSDGSDRLKEKMSISYLGRKFDIFEKLLEDNRDVDDKNYIKELSFKDDEWIQSGRIRKVSLSKLALNPNTLKTVREELDNFVMGRENFERYNLPYKLSIILHGIPGTGKTSLIRSLASEYDFNICVIPLAEMSNSSFAEAVGTVPSKSFILIEDFDSAEAAHKRIGVSGDKKGDGNSESKKKAFSFLTLSGLLNTLDGIKPLDNSILFLTTNVLSQIDSAVIRSGRVDKIIELPAIDSGTVKSYFESLFGETINFECSELLARDINKISFIARTDKNKALETLKEMSNDALQQNRPRTVA